MTPRRAAAIAGLTALTAVLVWLMFVALPRWYGRSPQDGTATAPDPAAATGRTINARATDRAPFRVLEPANMPAVLIEMGYLTNAEQEKQLAGSAFQNAFVQAVFDAIVEFRDALTSGAAQ